MATTPYDADSAERYWNYLDPGYTFTNRFREIAGRSMPRAQRSAGSYGQSNNMDLNALFNYVPGTLKGVELYPDYALQNTIAGKYIGSV